MSAQTGSAREQVLSSLLRGMARRLYRLRRDYKIASVDPWENPEYCSKANWAMDCGPALRDWDLCIYHAREEHRDLRARVAELEGVGRRIVADYEDGEFGITEIKVLRKVLDGES